MYDVINGIPFKCNRCGYEESDREKMPRRELWCTKDTRGVLDTYSPNYVLTLKGDQTMKDGWISAYNSCPVCSNVIKIRIKVIDNRLTSQWDFGEEIHGRYYE